MKVTEVQIHPVKANEGLIAFASCVLDGAYFIGSIAVYTKLSSGYRLVYPTKVVGNRHMHHHHPITREMSEVIEAAIFCRIHEIFG